MNNISELQKKILEILKAFHEFCGEHDLTYYALGGTILGALRHKGFIPWDDDADVGMPREDFEKLCGLLKEKAIGEKYILETPYTANSDYSFPYCKLYDKDTILIENTRKELIRGVYIDIFPLDGLGNTLEESKRLYKAIDIRMRFLSLKKVKISSSRSAGKNLILFIAQHIPSCIISEKQLALKINDLCKTHPFAEHTFGGNLVGAWGYREVMERSIFGSPQLYCFEDFRIYGPEQADMYLTHQYGNWKELPPVEKRISHHDRFVDLNKPYSEYK